MIVDASPPPQPRVRRLGRRLAPYFLLSPGVVWLGLFLVVPLVLLLYTSLESGSLLAGGFKFSWAFSNYRDAISGNARYFERSLVYAIFVTIACLILAYPMMYWVAFYGGRRKSSFLLLILLPFFVSFVIRTVQWSFILADRGIILGPLKAAGLLPQDFRVLATPFAVVAGMVYNFLPFTALPLYVALERIDKHLVEAAKDLYSSRWQAFRHVIVPLSLPGVFAAFLLTFVPATGDYVNASVLGGTDTTMIGNIIQNRFLIQNSYNQAAALAAVLMLGLLVLVVIYARMLGTEDVARSATG